jgi:hypothetical protein
LICSLIRFGELILVAGPELLININIKASGVSFVQTLASNSGKVFSMNILSMKTMNMSRVARNMLSLELMSRATNPSGALLDLEIVRD